MRNEILLLLLQWLKVEGGCVLSQEIRQMVVDESSKWYQMGFADGNQVIEQHPKAPDHFEFGSPKRGECMEEWYKQYFAGYNAGERNQKRPERMYQEISVWGLKPFHPKQPEAASV